MKSFRNKVAARAGSDGTKAFLPLLKASGEGHIVNISSISARMDDSMRDLGLAHDWMVRLLPSAYQRVAVSYARRAVK